MAATRLHALLLADHIYQDRGSGKYLIAGTFSQINVSTFPTTLGRTVGVFVSLSGVQGDTNLDVEFLAPEDDEVLMRTRSLEVHVSDPDMPVEFALETPPLPLPRPGRYVVRLRANGEVVATTPVDVTVPQAG